MLCSSSTLCLRYIMLESWNWYQKCARNSLDFANVFLEFVRAHKLWKSMNKYAGVIFVNVMALCPVLKKMYIKLFS